MSITLPRPQNLYEAVRPNSLDDVVGNLPVVRKMRNLLSRGSVRPGFIIAGAYGTGKTSMARVSGRIITCEDLKGLVPCGVCHSCTFSPRAFSSWGMGITVRNCADYSIGGLKRDFLEERYAHAHPLVLVLDEYQRAKESFQDLLLTLLEDDTLNMVVLVVTADQSKIDPALAQRLVTIEMKPPTTDEAMALLRNVRDRFEYRVSDEKLREICSATGNVLRACLNLLQVADAEEDS